MVAVPLVVEVEPAGEFRDWLLGRVQAARANVTARRERSPQRSRASTGGHAARAMSASTLARP
jgi:hypothetical protein